MQRVIISCVSRALPFYSAGAVEMRRGVEHVVTGATKDLEGESTSYEETSIRTGRGVGLDVGASHIRAGPR